MKTLEGFLSELRQRDVQLWLEGDRLRYRAPEGTMTPALVAELKARKAEILSFLQQVSAVSHAQRPPLVAIARSEPAPLSFAQQRFWLLHQFEPDSSAHNMPVVIRLTGKLNIAVLEESLTELVRRHEILRTTFPVINGEPRQVVAPATKISVPVVDLSMVPVSDRNAEALRLTTEIAQKPFNLAEGPMLYVGLFRLATAEYLFIWSIHCITGDGSSSDIFYQEFTTLYAAFSAGKPSPLPPLPIQYADFAQWQRDWLQGEVLERQLAYWKQQLSGSLTAVQLPTDYPRPPLQTFRGDRCPRMFSKQLHSDLLKLSQQTGTTLFMILLAAFKTLLYRYSGQDDLLISFTNAGRNQIETEKLIGFFSGTLLLRTNFAGNPTFRELLQRVREEALEAYANQDLPFEKLVEELRPEQNQSRSPLFQIKFALNPPWTNGRGMSSVYLPDLTIDSLFGYIYHGKTKFDLILVMREQEQGLGAVFDYNADLFDLKTAERMMDHFQMLLEGIVANPDQSILDLPLLTSTEQHQQLVEWNQTQTSYDKTSNISAAFATQLQQTPAAIAIKFANQFLTYAQLDKQANQVAHYLQTLGIRPGERVGICLERSPQLIIALLGILKAGCTYVPLNLADSPERQVQILESAQVTYLFTQQLCATMLMERSFKVICLDAEQESIQCASSTPINAASPDYPVYVLCISDATGKLDHWSITHRGVLNLTQMGAISPATYLHHTVLSHPVAAFEIWACLLTGSCLVIAPPTITLEGITQIVHQEQITDLWLPPRWLHSLVDLALPHLKSLRRLLTGGDVVSVAQAQTLLRILPDCQLTHVHLCPGNTVFSCANPITDLDSIDTALPIGKPIANTQVYLLNSHQQLVPLGVPGELYVGGDGLALNPEASCDRFIPHPFQPDSAQSLYCTGELARYLPNGQLELIGHRNATVTIRDWRIELARIETLLGQHPAIRETVVLAHPDLLPDEAIVAYLVFHPQQSASIPELRNYLRQKFPTLMVPSYFVVVEAIPLTKEGWVNIEELPFPKQALQPTSEGVTYNTELEQKLTAIWQDLFNLTAIDVQDNFFDLGGDSLLAVQLFAQIEQIFGKKLPLSVLLQAPTIAQLAAQLCQTENADAWSPLVTIQPGDSEKIPLFCIHGAGFNVLVYRPLALNLGAAQPVYGLQARGLDGENVIVHMHIEEIAADYVREIQKVRPHGPYCLAGLSNGGNIALEMAQQLRSQGHEVALLALFDTYGPNGATLMPPFPRFLSSVQYAFRYSLPRFVRKALQHNPKSLLAELSTFAGARQLPAYHRLSETEEKALMAQSTQPTGAPSHSNQLYNWMNKFSQYIIDHSSWSFLPSALLKDVQGSMSDTIKQLDQTYSQAQKAYTPQNYTGKITLFQAIEAPPGFSVDPFMGWEPIAKGGIEVYKIPGNHTSIMESKVLARKLAVCLPKSSS